MRNLQTTLVFGGALLLAGFGLGWLMGLSTTPLVATIFSALLASAAAILGALGGVETQKNAEANAEQANDAGSGGLPRWNTRINPLPLAFLALGIVIGSIFGVRARNFNWLGSDVANEVQKWTDTGLTEKAVAERLFENKFPAQYQVKNQEWLSIRDASEISKTLAAEVAMWESLGLERATVLPKLFALRYPEAITSTPVALGSFSQASSLLFEKVSEACERIRAEKPKPEELRQALLTSGVSNWQAYADKQKNADLLQAYLEGQCEPQ